jgi:hypothetical protein
VILRLVPNEWVPVPGTPVELNSECDTMVRRGDDGSWQVAVLPGRLLVRITLPDGRKSWPWPVTPLPKRG